MSNEQIIKQAIAEIAMAEALVEEAKQTYYRARKKLESIYSPTSPKRAKALSDSEIAKIIGKRRKYTMSKTN